MDIRDAVTEFGTDAVKEYRGKAAIRGETSIPETCLSLHIASSLITDGRQDARVEVPYSKILRELGVQGPDISPKFGGQRADIAIYENGLPSAIIEIKIIDEGRKPTGVVEDWRKIRLLQQCLASRGLPIISGFVGALVCDISGKEAEIALEEIRRTLGLDPTGVAHGPRSEALARGWGWLFACAKLEELQPEIA